jgi:hypothetical protein
LLLAHAVPDNFPSHQGRPNVLKICFPERSTTLAKPNFDFQKRQKEIAKKKKNEEKKLRKQQQKNAGDTPQEPGQEPVEAPAEEPAE